MANVRSLILVLGVTLLLGSCTVNQPTDSGNPTSEPILAGRIVHNPFVLRFGEVAVLESEGLEVTFVSVPHDSRCPSDVLCFWEGMAVVELRVVIFPADTHVVRLLLRGTGWPSGGPPPPPLDTLGCRFLLFQLDPYPVSTVPLPDSAYAATLAIFRHPHLGPLDGEVQLTDLPPDQIHVDEFDLQNARVDGEVLTLRVSYSGGCRPHDFELFLSPPTFLESLPGQANLYLRHTANGDPCEAWLSRDLAFDLRPIAHLHQVLYGYLDCVVLNVHRFAPEGSPPDPLVVLYRPHGAEPSVWCRQRVETAAAAPGSSNPR